jgi:bifunctional non-homologous end joining protein LigD
MATIMPPFGRAEKPIVAIRWFRYNLLVFGPRYIRPCSPVRATKPPTGIGWLHEPKFDGSRLQIVKDGPTVRLYSRNGNDWTHRLPALTDALTGIPSQSVVIDAELVFPDGNGSPSFYGLRDAIGRRRDHELAVFAFDLLYRNGEDQRDLTLAQRRVRLERLLARSKVPCLYLVDSYIDGTKLLEAAERHGLEGIVSKRRAAPYRSGECRDWVKVKTAAWREANRERWRMFERLV